MAYLYGPRYARIWETACRTSSEAGLSESLELAA
jgi:hypothetical protein